MADAIHLYRIENEPYYRAAGNQVGQFEAADHKLIVMMTDGEPSDIDLSGDDYLVEDPRYAVANAASRGIRTVCLTLDRHADGHVHRILGVRNYLIADCAAAFVSHTEQALVRLVAH